MCVTAQAWTRGASSQPGPETTSCASAASEPDLKTLTPHLHPHLHVCFSTSPLHRLSPRLAGEEGVRRVCVCVCVCVCAGLRVLFIPPYLRVYTSPWFLFAGQVLSARQNASPHPSSSSSGFVFGLLATFPAIASSLSSFPLLLLLLLLLLLFLSVFTGAHLSAARASSQ